MSNLSAQDKMGDDEHVELIEDLQNVQVKNPEDECTCGSERCQELILSQELDIVLSPTLTYRSSAQLERLWPLLTNRSMELSSYLDLLKEYQAERHCGTAWLQDFVAYRCRTCSDSPNMAICADCFKNGNHQGHDYNMFKSGSGGACDCGFEIVKESGHCSRHGQNATAKRANDPVPETLVCSPRRMMPRLIHRLAIQLRKGLPDINVYLDCLMRIANSTAVLRRLMIDALISEEVYSSQINVLTNQAVGNKQTAKIFKDGLKCLEHERKCLKPFEIPKEWRPPTYDITAFCDNVTITCFIDELVFWMIVYELPEKLVCFLLGLLMDEKYRQIFARSFVRNYPRILLTLIGIRGEPSRHLTRESYDKLSRRILHVSVQLYCHPDLTRQLCDEEYVLHTIIYCLRAAIEGTSSDSGVLEPNRLCPPTNHMPMVVNTEGALIRDRHLRSFTGDLYNILACENEVFRLLNDPDLLNCWLEMLSTFQTMNPYKRELNEHTLYENGLHMSVFAVEADFCHSPMWSILSCLKKETTIKSTQSLLSALHANLARWFYGMGIGPNSLLDPYHMSFHMPIHRMFASTLRNMMFTQGVNDLDLTKFMMHNQASLGTRYSYRSASGVKTPITFTGFVKMLLLHPLQALTLYNEIRSTMWTRNGISVINQAITYVHCACSFSTVDLDMFLLKYSASKLNPNYFIKTLMSRFHAWKWLSFKSNILINDSIEEVRQLYHFNILPEQVILMVESSLVTLIQLLTLSIYCNVSEKEQTRQEMVALISVIDRSYSYLLNMLPDRGVTNFGSANQDFVLLLDELTSYKPAQHGTSGNLQQGSYTLKPNVWDMEYDPIQVLYRFYQKRDYQMSLERYFQHAKLTGKLDRRYHPSTLWPPLKIPRNLGLPPQHLNLVPLFGCQALIGLVFTIIHKNLYYVDVPDSIMAYTIHLLELSLRTCLSSDQTNGSDKEVQRALKGNHQKATIDPSFNGRYSMKELKSCPAYFGSKDESNIKGNTIFSVPGVGGGGGNGNGDNRDDDGDDRLFPVVKNALDLGFDSTWFPFKSVLENCLVHIENVHLLPWREFETLLESQRDPESKPDKTTITNASTTDTKTTTNSGQGGLLAAERAAQSSDVEMYWSEQEYDETGIEEMIDDIDPDEDVDDADGEEVDEEEEDDDDDDGDGDDGEDDEDDTNGDVADQPLLVWPSHGRPTSGALLPVDDTSSMMHANLGDHENDSTDHMRRQHRQQQQHHQQQLHYNQQQTSSNHQRQDTGNTSSAQTLMVAESLPESQSNALSLIPIRGHANSSTSSLVTGQTSTNNDNNSAEDNNNMPDRSMYPENLVTQRQALEAPEAVPMLEDSPQPLALEAAPGAARRSESLRAPPSSQVGGGTNSNREEGSLSETDIHARFVGFFQPRQAESQRSHLRGFRQRQVARRPTGHRHGPVVTPLTAHNPDQTEPYRQGAVTWLVHPVAQGAAAHNNNNTAGNNNNNNNNNYTTTTNENENPPGGEQHSRGEATSTTAAASTATTTTTASTTPMMMLTEAIRDATAVIGARDPRSRRQTQCSCTTLNRALSNRLQHDFHQRRLRRDRMHHGESLLSLLLRLHAKYSHRANSYEYNESRAKANSNPDRTRIGDGVHFVTIVLDLICQSNQRMRAKVGQLQRLIWAAAASNSSGSGSSSKAATATNTAVPPTASSSRSGTTVKMQVDDVEMEQDEHHCEEGQLDSSKASSVKLEQKSDQGLPMEDNFAAGANQGPESGTTTKSKVEIPSTSLDPSERRRRAKEFQNRLMADFASKQRAFMEKYESSQRGPTDSGVPHTAASGSGKSDKIELEPDEEPINLSSKMSPPSSHQEERPQMSEADKQAAAAAATTPSSMKKLLGHKQELTSTTTDNSAASSSSRLTSDEQQWQNKPSTSRGNNNTEQKQQQEQEPTYECCICGGSGTDDLTNPLGQVVLLQATSVYGHAHLRPRNERRLPCDDIEQLQLQEETYAKYLSRRIDLMCEHFCESSRLDTINIGAEGGVHVQSCGHYLHVECHQSYIKSLDQEDRPHARQDTDGFLCPVCRQLANSVLPILGGTISSSASAAAAAAASAANANASPQSPTSSQYNSASGIGGGELALRLEQQIKLIGSLLEHRSAPNQRELQSSASFCQHLTKATGSEYRRIKSEPNMHSLFLFLTSIARTNLETEVIMRSSERTTAANSVAAAAADSGSGTANSTTTASCTTPGASMGGTGTDAAIGKTTSTPAAPTSYSTTPTTFDEAPRRRQRSCFLLLFQVLALNSRTLIEDHWFTYDQLWAHLTHQADEKNRLSVKPMKRSEVPLLLRDPTAMLLQFLFAITDPKHLSYQATNFTCLVQMLFNLTVIQSIALVLSYIKPQDKAKLLPPPPQPYSSSSSVSSSLFGSQQMPADDCHTTGARPTAATTKADRVHDNQHLQGVRGEGGGASNESSQLPDVSASYDTPIHCSGATTTTTTTTTKTILPSAEEIERAHERTNQFSYLLESVLSNLSPLLLPTNEEPLLDQRVRSRWSTELLMDGLSREESLSLAENRTKLACLPFLRGAALIRHHLYGQPMPDLESLADDGQLGHSQTIEADFSKLIGYLQLGHSTEAAATTAHFQSSSGARGQTVTITTGTNTIQQRLVDALNWPPGAQKSLVSSWSAELLRFGSEFSIAARSLLVCRPLAWHRPSLMQLPDSFDDIFLFYYRKACSLCHQVPKDVAICLVCGAPVCFRNGCCKARSGSRQLHSHHCGAGTAIFLAIQTSSIVVIRGNRACVWGSVYLDAHDEEDSGLQRGKPLHLVQARYRLLEDQWLTHTFDHTCGKRWIYLQEQ